jgi:hypothetical protein
MATRTTIRSWPAMLLAGVFVGGTAYVLFNDLIEGAPITTGHVLTALALAGAVASGHMMVSMARDKRYVLMAGHFLLACAATLYVATMSGTRNSEYGAVKVHKIEARNEDRVKVDSIIKIAEGELADLKAAEVAECRKVGRQCELKTGRRKDKEISLEDLRRKRAAMGSGEVPNAGLKVVAEGISMFPGVTASQDKIERLLVICLPWLAVLIAELGTIMFLSSALGHKSVSVSDSVPVSVPAETPKALSFERPLTDDEVEQIRRILEGRSAPVTNDELAALAGVTKSEMSKRVAKAVEAGKVVRLKAGRFNQISLVA